MDPFHPLLPIEPARPAPPDYVRVERVARDQDREAAPDWSGPEQGDRDDEGAGEHFDDAYDPAWPDPASADTGYHADGHAPQPPPATVPNAGWHPARDGERRRGRPEAPGPDDGEDPQHIDITA
jgi:hypothetical protein